MARRSRYTKASALALDVDTASMSDLKKAYTALRDAFVKQRDRLAAGTEAQQEYAAPFLSGGSQEWKVAKLSKITGREYWKKGLDDQARQREMKLRVEELQVLVESPRYSLSGWKEIEKRTVATLQEHGYENITKSNLKQFGVYMEAMRDLYGEQFFPSAEVAEAYESEISKAGRQLTSAELGQLIIDVRLKKKGGFSNGVDLFA